MNEPILVKVEGLKKYFPLKTGFLSSLHTSKKAYVKAVDDVNFCINSGELLCIAGESGSGKTTVARLLVRLNDPTDGKIYFKGFDIASLKGSRLRNFKREVQMIFQDPYEAFDPRYTVFTALVEPLLIHKIGNKAEREELVFKALVDAELKPPEEFIERYPYELSGGQRQRMAIMRAMLLRPKLLIADEPLSMLDASIRSGIINLILKLTTEHNLAVMLITHDLAVARHTADRIAIMYLGKIFETASSEIVTQSALHPYTIALLNAVPSPDPLKKQCKTRLKGETPNPLNMPSGCRFYPRCSYAKEVCQRTEPPLSEIRKGHYVACHRVGEIPLIYN